MKPWIPSLAFALFSAGAAAAEYPAVLVWSQRATLSTPVSGVVTKVAVTEGERVAEGQLLLQLDQRPFNSALRLANAQVHKHRLQRDEARRELQRTRELYERTVISVHDLQVQEIATAGAESDCTSAEETLAVARLELEHSSVHAPFSGLILETPVTVGETVVNSQQATPMIVLASDRPMLAEAALDAVSLRDMVAGMAATVSIDGRRFPGKVLRIGSEPDERGRYRLQVVFESGEQVLRAGLPAMIELTP